MKTKAVAAVMIHVPDWKEGLAWYSKAFRHAKRISLPEFDFECPDCKLLAQRNPHKILVGSSPVKALHRSIVDLKLDLLQFLVTNSVERSALGSILYEYPYAVLVGSSLAR